MGAAPLQPALTEAVTTLHCRPDDEGEVVATLVRPYSAQAGHGAPPAQARAVLSLHGYVDYYFHPHVAQAFLDQGISFYALDLRKYGRSLRPHQTPFYCRSMSDYDEEITLALRQMAGEGARDITLLGHSTGCLIGALYTAEGAERGLVRRLVLNSPFLEFAEPWLLRKTLAGLAGWRSRHAPYSRLPIGIERAYGESLHRAHHGEWEYNLAWKPLEVSSTSFAWVHAVAEGHKRVQAGLNLTQPVLLLHSDRSIKAGKRWHEELQSVDGVLNVAHMKQYGPGLGRNVTLREIPGGQHDLFLSRAPARTAALAATMAWLAQQPA